ncbi:MULTISPECIES: hypothetical protein [unclassified Carboxylicivirga]|uniref:hypothetical protein n=1 Tax=Carboxylicivirga TaxID=1628153 RepID=UPI003D32983A
MKVNFNRNLKALNGNDLTEPIEGGGKKVVTLKDVCASALANKQEGDELEKLKAYKLAVDIATSTKAIEVSVEQVAEIKKALKPYPVLYCGQACMMLEEN